MIDLSKLNYNSGYGWYDASTSFKGKTIYAYVSGKTGESLPDLTARVNKTIAGLDANLDAILAFCVEELLEDKNADWVNDAHPTVTEDEFKRSLTLGALRFQPDRSLLLTFTDGGLFWGHWVMVKLSEDYTPTQAYLEG